MIATQAPGESRVLILELTDREATILAEVRAMVRLSTDADVLRVAMFRLARELDIANLHPSDWAISGNRARMFHVPQNQVQEVD